MTSRYSHPAPGILLCNLSVFGLEVSLLYTRDLRKIVDATLLFVVMSHMGKENTTDIMKGVTNGYKLYQ